MVFELGDGDSNWDDLDYSGSPKLSVFFPPGSDCKELNYGQGEGQVLIDGHEWGFYYGDQGHLLAVLHDGDLSVEEASLVVSRLSANLSTKLGSEVRFALREVRPAQ